jgi:hypothetical protein
MLWQGRLSASSCVQWEQDTTILKRAACGDTKERERNNNQNGFFFPSGEGAIKRNRMSEEVTSAIIYCRENRELLHKYYEEIAKERMHRDDYHLIEKHKALLPTFEHEKDAESKIDVGVDEDKEW